MAIVRVASSAGDSSFASTRTVSINNGAVAGRVVLGQWDNDNTTEHLISSTYGVATAATLGTEEVYAGTTNANVSYLIGDSSVLTGTNNFKGTYTDGNHKPGCVVATYTGVSAISVVAKGHGDTGGTPNVPVSLTAGGFNSGDVAVAFFAFFSGAGVTYTNVNGTAFINQAATSFRYIGSENTAAGSSVTIGGTPGSRIEWIGFMFRLQPLSSNTLKTVLGLDASSIKTVNGLARASIKTFDGLTPP